MKRDLAYIIKARAAHHDALKAMLPAGSTLTGLAVWRKLRKYECMAHTMAEKMCNEPTTEDEQEAVRNRVECGVRKIFGRDLPGFFINWDPRGWALKLEPGSVPYPLYQDWGRYQILAPLIA